MSVLLGFVLFFCLLRVFCELFPLLYSVVGGAGILRWFFFGWGEVDAWRMRWVFLRKGYIGDGFGSRGCCFAEFCWMGGARFSLDAGGVVVLLVL